MTLHHVTLEVAPDRVEAEVAFWARLGFERVASPANLTERGLWMRHGATQVHLLFVDAPVRPPQGHTAVVVDDYDATVAGLRAAGVAVEDRERHWGSPRSFTRSPGGHRVELMAFAPGG
jgi:catechol 2,3-dioxygenase-like lactoylglutathione lyase family enzyme